MNKAALLLIAKRLLVVVTVALLCLFLMGCSSAPASKPLRRTSAGLRQNLKNIYSPLTRVPPAMAAPAFSSNGQQVSLSAAINRNNI